MVEQSVLITITYLGLTIVWIMLPFIIMGTNTRLDRLIDAVKEQSLLMRLGIKYGYNKDQEKIEKEFIRQDIKELIKDGSYSISGIALKLDMVLFFTIYGQKRGNFLIIY